MLTLHNGTPDYKDITPDLTGAALPPQVTWIDILDGTGEEIAYVERATGHRLPTLADLQEIETSSRLRFAHDMFILSTPIVSRDKDGVPHGTPVGFILTKNLLVTVRFAPLKAFASFAEDYTRRDALHAGGIAVFTGLIDAIIDRAADILEEVGGELDLLSQSVFGGGKQAPASRQAPAHETASLRETLRRIGFNGDLSSKIRDSLLGIARIVSYVAGLSADMCAPELRIHMETQRHDIASLADYDAHLANKVQLLLDATMGLINIEQNNIIKVLTIVSVVGVPPTLVASMYGMNFHNMPELSWAWGYPYGLALIAVSAIAPLLWFKMRGWL
ncbi:MAG: magnesium transporter CorA family protein [Alphaproteobacteria bacterium]|nr:magnesium transporter CorA family protein [Alphaproteobacteria bacterium]